jgi:hypothetical protein
MGDLAIEAGIAPCGDLLTRVVGKRLAGLEGRDANRQIPKHSRNQGAIGGTHGIAIILPKALAVGGIIVRIRLAFGDLRLAQRLDLRFALSFAPRLKRNYITLPIGQHAERSSQQHERGGESKRAGNPGIISCALLHPLPPIIVRHRSTLGLDVWIHQVILDTNRYYLAPPGAIPSLKAGNLTVVDSTNRLSL